MHTHMHIHTHTHTHTHTGTPLLATTFRGACDLLLVMIEQKCSVAGLLYNLLAQGYQQAYADTSARHLLQADLRYANDSRALLAGPFMTLMRTSGFPE